MVKNPPVNAEDTGDVGLIRGSGRFPGGGNGKPLQDSCWKNLMERGAWWASPWNRKESDTTERAHTNIHKG